MAEFPSKLSDWTELFELLQPMLQMDPQRRPSAEEVLKHPWFTRTDEDENTAPVS